MQAGDIVALVGLKETKTGDTLCDPKNPISYESIHFPEPVISQSIEPKTTSDEGKLMDVLQRFVDEDPTVSVTIDKDSGQTLISGMGELHLEILIDRIRREFKLDTHAGKPQVSYRETIQSVQEIKYTCNQMIGGKTQFAQVVLKISPIHPSDGIVFDGEFESDDIPKAFINSVKQGVMESSSGGILSGYPLVGVKVMLSEMSIRDVETTEMACKIAGSMGLQEACRTAEPILLEPIMSVEITSPQEYVGVVINDITGRRGKVMGVTHRRDMQIIDAEAPLAEMFGYATALRSLTQGRAVYSMQFKQFEKTAPAIQNEILQRIGRDTVFYQR
jgi:elongation factor G